MSETPAFAFGTVGTPISTPRKPGGSLGAVIHSRALELGALELAWVQSVRVSEGTCARIRAAGAEQGVALSVHAPYFINLNANDDEWPKSRKRLMDAAHYGHLAGATEVIFHPGSYFGRPPQAVLEVAIPRLRGCVEELRATGNPATLRPETMGKSAMLGSLEDTLAMAREIEGVAPCIDIAHLHARAGDGSVNSYEEFAAILRAVEAALGPAALKRLHFHASGIEYGPKGEKKHLKLEESDLRVADFFRALVDFDCAGRVLCESPIMEEDALLMKRAWEEAVRDAAIRRFGDSAIQRFSDSRFG
ncbi:MAG: TIM barrel protein, partial [Chloroflexi bacterium]|nr:TIM barrel protein [Chloroflexota bacterium]